MNAIELLTQQHDEVEALIVKIERTRDRATKRVLFAELADKLAAHATIEEEVFYPAVYARQTEDLLRESTEEHLQIKRVLVDLLELDVDDDQFDAKLAVMKENIEHHARDEEEGELFPKVEQLFDDGDLEGLADEMEILFEDLLVESPRLGVWAEIDEAAAL